MKLVLDEELRTGPAVGPEAFVGLTCILQIGCGRSSAVEYPVREGRSGGGGGESSESNRWRLIPATSTR
jgi:hypothetical protein